MFKYQLFVNLFIVAIATNVYAQPSLSPLKQATVQFGYALEEIDKIQREKPSLVSPRSIDGDSLIMSRSKDWTSGFFAGNLWYMYELSGDEKWLEKAKYFTEKMEVEKSNATTHDMGFKMYCSFGNGYRLSKPSRYRDILIEAATTLSSRYNEKIGSLRSWDHSRNKWDFPVIIDNMMNLELLFWAFKETKDSTFYKIAVNHANTSMKNHYREDFSSFHVIDYDVNTGKVIKKNTHQGYSHESAWARGQAWGLYGFTMCYRETGDVKYLRHAENIARFILTNPNVPSDLIPYWDYNVPDKANQPRDVSAATITASALYELSTLGTEKSKFYKKSADEILRNISDKFTSAPNTNKGFLLTNSTGNLPSASEINVPIVYADYYYLEALVRKNNLKSAKR